MYIKSFENIHACWQNSPFAHEKQAAHGWSATGKYDGVVSILHSRLHDFRWPSVHGISGSFRHYSICLHASVQGGEGQIRENRSWQLDEPAWSTVYEIVNFWLYKMAPPCRVPFHIRKKVASVYMTCFFLTFAVRFILKVIWVILHRLPMHGCCEWMSRGQFIKDMYGLFKTQNGHIMTVGYGVISKLLLVVVHYSL